MFKGSRFVVIPHRLTDTRRSIFEKGIHSNGGEIVNLDQLNGADQLCYVVVEDHIDETFLWKHYAQLIESPQLQWVKSSWISKCLKLGKLVDFREFIVPLSTDSKTKETKTEETHKRSASPAESDPIKKKSKFACEQSSADVKKEKNHNQLITDKLQVLADGYRSSNDRWRVFSYEKAINTLKKYPKAIESAEELKEVRGIGDKIQKKIAEILETGDLKKAEEFASNEKLQTLNLFVNMHGVGPTIAEQWYVQGLRTLEDVEAKAKLSNQQKIGLRYYHEFLDRMPRSEAHEIVETVTEAAKKIGGAELICQGCGSYRRQKETCGDVDILITHPDGETHKKVLKPLLKALTDTGFLTDHLVEGHQDGTQEKYMGVCQLPHPTAKHRRIDIITVPYSEYSTSLIYFTGSEHFTRSIYLRAKKMGMRLNAHGLRDGVVRQGGEVISEGHPVDTPTEQSVFDYLKLEYLDPPQRDHP